MKGAPRLKSHTDPVVTDWATALVNFLEGATPSTDVGQIAEFVSLPPGWLPADGSAFSAASHPNLVRALGSNNLPNLSPVYDPSHVVGIKA